MAPDRTKGLKGDFGTKCNWALGRLLEQGGRGCWCDAYPQLGLRTPDRDRFWAVFGDLGRLILKLFVLDRRSSHLRRYVGAQRFRVRGLETLGPTN